MHSPNLDGGPKGAGMTDSVSNTDRGLIPERLTHLQRLEGEAIHIMREVVAETEKPVMLYSVGKDSSVMLHIALKAFIRGVRRFRFYTSHRAGISRR